MHTAQPLVIEASSFEVEIAIEKLKQYKSPVIDQILAEVIQAESILVCSEIQKINNSVWNKEELPEQ
jgi:hypothetical protein